jgi:hypothetical protein
MEHIDKTRGAQQAHALLDAFLSRCSDGGFSIGDDLYAKMGSDKDSNAVGTDTTYNTLKRQLLNENSGRCCYCMRSIDERNTTLEHIIPNKTEDYVQYDKYRNYYPRELWGKMIFSKDFLANPRWPFRAFPHTVAYENLIPSCNGKFARSVSEDIHAADDRTSKCCNNKRSDEFVIPFVLNQHMVDELKYKPNGLVVWPVTDSTIRGDERKKLLEEHKKTIDALDLNCPELVAIRRIWFFLTSNGEDCVVADRERVVFTLTEDKYLAPDENAMLLNFWNDNYWCLLEEYRYFNDLSKFDH